MPKWRFRDQRMGSHTVMRDGQRIRLTPADGVFEAEKEELAGAMDKFVRVDTGSPPRSLVGSETPPEDFADLSVVMASPGWYDVVDQQGRPINDKKLRREEAIALAGGDRGDEKGTETETDPGEAGGAEA